MYGADAPHTVEYQIYRGEATHNISRIRESRVQSQSLHTLDFNAIAQMWVVGLVGGRKSGPKSLRSPSTVSLPSPASWLLAGMKTEATDRAGHVCIASSLA